MADPDPLDLLVIAFFQAKATTALARALMETSITLRLVAGNYGTEVAEHIKNIQASLTDFADKSGELANKLDEIVRALKDDA